jgi:hypothetical protein
MSALDRFADQSGGEVREVPISDMMILPPSHLVAAMKGKCVVAAISGNTRRHEDPRRGPLTAKELVENAAAIGPEHQHHTHQGASSHHARRDRQGELLGELRFPSFEEERS